jgi:hypothetical protein
MQKEEVTMNLSFRGDPFVVSSEQNAYIGTSMTLLGSMSTISFGAGTWEVWAVRSEDGTYRRTEKAGGSTRTGKVSIPESAYPAELLHRLLERFDGPEGTVRQYDIYNMTLEQILPLTITYRGEVNGGRRFTAGFWGMEEDITLDPEGMVMSESMSLGIQARPRGDNERTGSLPLERLLATTSVPARGVPADIALRKSVRYRIEGSFTPPPDTLWQVSRREGDAVIMDISRPVPGSGTGDLPGKDIDTMGLDLDSPRIKELAAEITAGIDDPWQKVSAIAGWVYDKLGKSMRECFTATEALEAGEGECQTHSILTVSLLRSAGIPARFAYGVVYLPGERDSFFFHTWVEAGVDKWIPVDPTLGSIPAGVDHITLKSGSYRDQFTLFPYILDKAGWRVVFQEDALETN